MIGTFDDLLVSTFSQLTCSSLFEKIRELSYGVLRCEGKATITAMLTEVGKQFCDWSSTYRLFSETRVDMKSVFRNIFLEAVQLCTRKDYVVVHLDDTVIKKTGKKIPGTSWRRDPLGPPFCTNFIWGQRFMKLSVSVPEQATIGPARSIPIQLLHCPSAQKPKYNATDEQRQEYKEQLKQKNLNVYGNEAVNQIRTMMDECGMENKKLVLAVDGSYTNGSFIKNLPSNVALIGRIRKDAKFNLPAEQQPHTGRRKIYGQELPTPEQIRQSDQYPWKSVQAWAAGKVHDFDIKVVENVMWRKTGKDTRLRLIVIRPLKYKLTKNSKPLYRSPTYLICTDPNISIQDFLQFYLWRWQIEVNIEEGKKMGIGQAQVRNTNSVELVPAFITAVYSLLHVAYLKCQTSAIEELMPRPKWNPVQKSQRITTGDILKCARTQIYCKGIGLSFSHFMNLSTKSRSTRNSNTSSIHLGFQARAS